MQNTAKRQEIIAEARRWLGARWHHAACVRYIAVDCAQILADIFHQCGLIERPDNAAYPRDWALHKNEEWFLAEIENYAHPVEKPLAGDIAIWRIGRTFSHSAIIVDFPIIIHADITEGVVLGNASSGSLSKREVRFYSVFKQEL